MATKQYVDDLRKLADLLEAHAEFGDPCGTVRVDIFPHPEDEKLHAASAIRSLGNVKKIYDGDDFRLEKKVGIHTLLLWYQRKQICTRVVVGTELVAAQPERVIPATPAHEREIVEWVCSPVLSKPAVEENLGAPELVGVASAPQLEADNGSPF